MAELPKYFVVRSKALPEVLLKVVEAKRMLEMGKAESVQDATEAVGISRSSFYKYKEDIFPFHESSEGTTFTLTVQMDDEPGLLSDLLKVVAGYGANILTSHQSIPIKYLMKNENLITFRNDDFTDKIKDIMTKNRYRAFPVVNTRGKYIGTVSRRNLLNIQKKKLILVDHNEKSQAVDNIEEAEIVEIIDHHRIGSLETFQPVMFRNQPVGCTATIMYQIYSEKYLDIPQDIAGLLCAAILSDTLMFRSPTCTEQDKEAATQLAQIAQIDIESFAEQMFRAGSNLSSKTPEEIFYQDYKKFIAGELVFGVGQISFMSEEELQTVKERLMPYMEKECGKHGVTMVFFMLTNIIKESTELICYGKGSDKLVYDAFQVEVKDESCRLEGVVSRKKQLIPRFMNALQQ